MERIPKADGSCNEEVPDARDLEGPAAPWPCTSSSISTADAIVGHCDVVRPNSLPKIWRAPHRHT